MNKKHILLTFSFLLFATFLLYFTKDAFAACKCRTPSTGVPAGAVNAAGDIIDSEGEKVPHDTYGQWISEPANEEPKCQNNPNFNPAAAWVPDLNCYTAGSRSSPKEFCACNIYTQTYFQTPFKVPTLGDLLGNVVRLFFFIAGIYALFLLLLGGFEWVSSGGEEKKLTSARQKILNAIIGLVVMVAVLTLVIVMEQVVFGGKVCLGISCPIDLGGVRIVGR